MCHYILSIYPCGDSYINRSTLCRNGPHCTAFEVVSHQRSAIDCFLCRRSPRRRKLPARARGIFAPSWWDIARMALFCVDEGCGGLILFVLVFQLFLLDIVDLFISSPASLNSSTTIFNPPIEAIAICRTKNTIYNPAPGNSCPYLKRMVGPLPRIMVIWIINNHSWYRSTPNLAIFFFFLESLTAALYSYSTDVFIHK